MITTPESGQVLDDRFVLQDLVGQGGMGSVFRALDLSTGRVVAVKVPFFELESDPVFFSRFQREIEIGSSLDHPGILKVFPVTRASRPYLAMEYLEGETLWDFLQRARPLPLHDALRIALMVCDALQYMHGRGVVHRDLKPNNIMLCHDGSLRIMDFGIAVTAAKRRVTFVGFSARLGTPHYMAPEQVRGRQGDARMDLYGLGAILYEMTTGHAPFEEQEDAYAIMQARLTGDPVAPRMHNPQITPEVEELILCAMAREPDDRYPSASAMKRDLCSPGRIQVTGRANRLTVPHVTAPHWRVVRVVAVALVIPVVLFFVFWLLLKR
jgi:serine/threonine protein kinase